jgi:hypothetical protein
MNRTGKIARLPRHIREEINCRLQSREKGRKILEWFGALPEVAAVTKAEFDGQSISEVNLSLRI